MDRQRLLVMDTEQLIAGAVHRACVLVCAACGGYSVFIDTPVDHEIIRRDWVQLPSTTDMPLWVHVTCPVVVETQRQRIQRELEQERRLKGYAGDDDPAYLETIIDIRQAMENGTLVRPGPDPNYVGEYDPWRDADDDPGMCFCARFGYHHIPGGW